MDNSRNHTNIRFTHNFSACLNIMCDESACQKSIISLAASFKMALRKNNVKVSHAKIIIHKI